MPTGNIIKIGDEFTNLTVLAPAGLDAHRKTLWLCVCKCFNLTWARTAQLNGRSKKSCGCLVSENATARNKAGATVRCLHPEEYDILTHIKYRCLNPDDPAWPRYGGRGIRICAGLAAFEEFYRIVGKRPTDQHSMDRRNNDGHYSCGECGECIKNGWPMNLRWATKQQQSQNRSITAWLTHDNQTHCLAEWSRLTGFNERTIASRLQRGLSHSEALTAPLHRVLKRKLNMRRVKR